LQLKIEFNPKSCFPGMTARTRSKHSHYWLVIVAQANFILGFDTFEQIVERNAFQTVGFVGAIVGWQAG
jgi:hypothetical protein